MADATMTYVLKAKDETEGAIKSAQGGLSGFAKQAASFAAGLGIFEAAKAGLSTIGGFLKESAEEARDAQTQMALYSQVLRQASGATEEQIVQLKNQAEALGKVGGVSKDVVMQTQATLATFDMKKESIEALTPALTDLLAQEYKFGATEDNARSISNAFGLVLQGNVGALSRYGFKFDEATEKILKTGTETERINALTEILKGTYEGANKTLGETAQGSMQRMNEQLKDIKENIGTFLLPIIDKFMQGVVFLTGKIAEWTSNMGSAGQVLQNLQTWFTNVMAQFEAQTGIISQVRAAFTGIWTQIKEQLLPAVRELWIAFQPYLPYLQALAKVVAAVLVVALKILIEAISLTVKWIISAVTEASKFATFIMKTLTPVAQALTVAINKIADALQWVIGKFGAMKSAATSAFTAAKNAVAQVPFIGPTLAGTRASGGPVSAGQSYLVGERGPEIFTPGRGGTILPNGMGIGEGQKGPTYNFTFNGDVTDRDSFVKSIIDAVNRANAQATASRAW